MTSWLVEAVALWPHVTWGTRRDIVYYRLRRLVAAPAGASARCIMGGPVSEIARCPRRVVAGELWCRRHMPESSRDDEWDVYRRWSRE